MIQSLRHRRPDKNKEDAFENDSFQMHPLFLYVQVKACDFSLFYSLHHLAVGHLVDDKTLASADAVEFLAVGRV